MDDNPFLIHGPASISFSGGRTSGMMLAKIVEAHDGALPPDVFVAFANTGKETPETLRFVHDCASHLNINVRWLEWRDGSPGYEEVGFNSASRNGEPFKALIDKKGGRLPNWKERWCTQYLKIGVMAAFLKDQGLEPGSFLEVIGLRHDEPLRILRALNNAMFRKVNGVEVLRQPERRLSFPLAKAKITKSDVMAFWERQPFDLAQAPHEGNCDLCFLKGRGIRKQIIRKKPHVASWWIRCEANGQWFDRRDSVAGLVVEVRRSPDLFDDFDEAAEHDSECGVTCGAD